MREEGGKRSQEEEEEEEEQIIKRLRAAEDRRRLDEDNRTSVDGDGCPWLLSAVLADSVTSTEVPMTKALAVTVTEKRNISTIVKTLTAAAPLGDLQHLKRVRTDKGADKDTAVHILLWKSAEQVAANDEEREVTARRRLLELGVSENDVGRVLEVGVACHLPQTRAQYAALRADHTHYWPTNFHEDKHLESLLAGTHPLWRRREELGTLMEGVGSDGGVVLDEGGRVLVRGRGSSKHPLGHTAMVLVDLVAAGQGGGAWLHKVDDGGRRTLIPKAALPGLASRDSSTGCQGTGYLCTGYTVLLAKEPCHLCAMALLHSRVATLVFGHLTRDGALSSTDKLHNRPGLNHRYGVFHLRPKLCHQQEELQWCS